jgi:hypothetical protein
MTCCIKYDSRKFSMLQKHMHNIRLMSYLVYEGGRLAKLIAALLSPGSTLISHRCTVLCMYTSNVLVY